MMMGWGAASLLAQIGLTEIVPPSISTRANRTQHNTDLGHDGSPQSPSDLFSRLSNNELIGEVCRSHDSATPHRVSVILKPLH